MPSKLDALIESFARTVDGLRSEGGMSTKPPKQS